MPADLPAAQGRHQRRTGEGRRGCDGRLVKRVRASIEPTTTGSLPPFDTQAAQASKCNTGSGGRAIGGRNGARGGAVRTFTVGAVCLASHRPRRCFGSVRRALADPADDHSACAIRGELRCFAQGRQLTGVTSVVRLRWLPSCDVGAGGGNLSRATCSESAKLFASLPPLPFAQRELDAARTLLGGSPSDEMLNTAFTADAVRHASLKDYRILHLPRMLCFRPNCVAKTSPPSSPPRPRTQLTRQARCSWQVTSPGSTSTPMP